MAELSPAQSLTLIEQERSRASRRRGYGHAATFGGWGLAWLVGFGSCYFAVTRALPWWLVVVLHVLAVTVSIVVGARANRGLRGPSQQVGIMFGLSWVIAPVVLTVINNSLASTGINSTLLWSGSSMFMVGLLYLAGGMVWQDLSHYLLGVWILLFAGVGVVLGTPANFLVVALAGGGGMLVQAGWFLVRSRR